MPSRLFLSWPGCATSAGTERSINAADREAVERHRRGARAAVGGVDVDRIVQHLDRQAGGLGGLLRQHHRARAGVEHHRHPRAVDVRGDREIAAAPAHDFDVARRGWRRGRASVRRSRGRRRRATRSDRCSRPPAAGRSRPRTASLRAPCDSRSRNSTSTSPPTNTTSAILSASEPTVVAQQVGDRVRGRCLRSTPPATARRR